MNKQTLKIVSLVAGILAAVLAVFIFVTGILIIKQFDGDLPAKYNAYIAILLILELATAAGVGVFGTLIIMNFFKGDEECKFTLYPALVLFASNVLGTFIGMCFMGFDNGMAWVYLVFYGAALALVLVALFAQLEKLVKGILILIAMGIGFVFAIVGLTQTGGIGIATGIFELFMFVAFFLYYLFKMIVEGTFSGSKSE